MFNIFPEFIVFLNYIIKLISSTSIAEVDNSHELNIIKDVFNLTPNNSQLEIINLINFQKQKAINI